MDLQNWSEGNNQYLAASLRWLRLRLERLGAQSTQAPAPPKSAQETRAGRPAANGAAPKSPILNRWFGGGARVARNEVAVIAAPLLKAADLGEQIARAASEREEAAKSQPPPALALLSDQLQLSPFERDILLLCAAMELDTRTAGLCALAQGDLSRPYPTFALALGLFDEPSWDALSAHRPLRYWRLLEIHQPGALPLTQSALRADERIVNYIKGLNALDDRLSAHLSPGAAASRGAAPSLSASQQSAVDQILWRWGRARESEPLPLAQLVGADAMSKQLVAQAAARALRRQMFVIGAESLPSQAAEAESLLRLWQRESQLSPLALYVEATYDAAQGTAEATGLSRFVARAAQSNSAILLGVRDPFPRLSAPTFSVEVNKPTLAEQRAAWSRALPNEDGAAQTLSDQLASQFSLNLPDIHSLAAGVDEHSDPQRRSARDQAWDLCNARARPKLDTLAQRLDAKATWHDLILAEEPLGLLKQIADQVRHRGRVYEDYGFAMRMNRGFGISALFAGESGTGKTMAAEVIANDLRLNLYRIDLSAVVSKYIGETEKNLRRLFDAAEDGGAILFFDEADALFGKRSEVKDSHDRYANIEINYLLQRMEAYSGLAILATNMKTALDQAFMRRLRFVVNFTFPNVSERNALWRKAFPAQLPQAELDWDRLARLNLTGGNIHSIALNAAFLTAQAGAPLTMERVLEAARMEFRKLNKPINEAEFAT
jgi:SpoVK/Ycf46/Vps4 family AAA+-type ATPase